MHQKKQTKTVPDHKVRYFWFDCEEVEGWHISIGMARETLCHLPNYTMQIQYLEKPTFGKICGECKALLGTSAATRVVAHPKVALWG